MYIGNPHNKKEWASIPVLPLDIFYLYISFWNSGKLTANWGDGNIEDLTPDVMTDATIGTPAVLTHNYSPKYNGDILISPTGGLKKVYSLSLFGGSGTDNRNRLNIDDFGEFINQFPNLYSLNIIIYNYSDPTWQGIVSGSLEEIPNSLKRYRIKTLSVVGAKATLNINNFSPDSQLEWLFIEVPTGTANQSVPRSGNLRNLPPNLNYFRDTQQSNFASYSYTGGRVWRSDFDTFYIQNFILSDSENDALLNDLANSVTSAVGDKIIRLRGARTSASDSAVLYLQGLGFTVTIVA